MSLLETAFFAVEQAYLLDGTAIPDYVAGFIYGMTGDNHLEEIETCYHGSTDVVSDAQKAIKLVQDGSYIKGFGEVGLIIREFPGALQNCKNMDDDIAAIESWATIFTKPEELAKTLSKNWLLHRRTIKEDLTKEQKDWADAAYFQAGIDTAMALTEAVGPIKKPEAFTAVKDVVAVPDFVAGFIYGLTGDLELEAIETCMESSSDLLKYIKSFTSDLKHVNIFKAILDLQKFIFHLQKDLAPCT
jgi:hypothetical protein